jgi:hypothetical protein
MQPLIHIMKKFAPVILSAALAMTIALPIAAKETASFSARAVFKGSLPGIGLTTTQLVRKVGQPQSRTQLTQKQCPADFSSTWQYQGFNVEVANVENDYYGEADGKIVGLEINSPTIATTRGVRVGDRLSKAVRLYSGAEIYTNSAGQMAVGVSNETDGGSLEFVADSDGRIKSIKVFTRC